MKVPKTIRYTIAAQVRMMHWKTDIFQFVGAAPDESGTIQLRYVGLNTCDFQCIHPADLTEGLESGTIEVL